MNKFLKIIFSIYLVLSFLSLNAQTTFNGGGADNNWNTVANWSAGVPTAIDAVTISSGVTVDVNVDGQCASLTFADNGATTTININSGITLTVSGDVDFGIPSVDGANQILNVDDGHLISANIYFPDTGDSDRDDQLWLSDGTVTVSGDIIGNQDAGARNYIDCSPAGVNGTGTITVGGDFYSTDNGIYFFDRGTSTVVYNGNSPQIVGNHRYYYNIEFDGTGKKTLLGNTDILGTSLALTNGVFDLDGNYVRLRSTVNISGSSFSSSKMIDLEGGGYIRRDVNDASDFTNPYPFGYGSDYNPINITAASGDVNGTLYFKLFDEQHPLTQGTDNTITKYWSISAANLAATNTVSATFTYSDSDIPAANEGDFDKVGWLNDSGWGTDAGISFDRATNTISLTNISVFWGDWTFGETAAFGTLPDKYTVANGNWTASNTAIWNGGVVPAVGDDVAILHVITRATDDVTVNSLEIVQGASLNLNSINTTVTTTTDISGTMTDSNNGGTNLFTGKLTINSTGSFTSANNSTFEFAGGIENNGTFRLTGNAAILNFTNTQTISGTSSITLDRTITISTDQIITNQNSNLIFEGIINGANAGATLINDGTISFQNLTASFGTAGTFDASTNIGNTVYYNGNGDQNIAATTYHNLILEDGNDNGSNKILAGNVIVNGDFTVENLTDFYPRSSDLTVTGTATILDRIYDDNLAGTCTFNGDAIIDGARFDGSQNGNYIFAGTVTALTTGFTIDRCNFTFNPDLVIPSGVTVSVIDANGIKTFNNITVQNGGTWSNTGNEAIDISGNLTVNTGATFTQGTGAYTFDGASKTIGGTISDIDFQNLIIDGTITNNISDIDIVGDITINSGSLTNEGDISTGDDIIVNAGSYINNSTTSVTDDISGAGSLTQGSNSTLYIGDDATITTFSASANPNTVEYNGNGNQTVNGGTYHHLIVRDGDSNNSSMTLGGDVTANGDFTVITSTYFDPMGYDFTVSGNTAIAGVFDDDAVAGTSNLQAVDLSGGQINGGNNGVVNILGNLTMPTGDASIGRADLTVSGTTTVPSGNSLTFNNVNGTKTFSDNVIVNGSWLNAINESFTISGNLTVNTGATFTQGTGTYTFDGTAKEINGTIAALTFNNLVATGTITNQIDDLTVSTTLTVTNPGTFTNNDNYTVNVTTLAGTGTFIQGTNSELYISGNPSITTLTANASGNLAEYTSAGNVNVISTTYHHLTVRNGNSKTLLGNVTVNGDFLIATTTYFDPMGYNFTVSGNTTIAGVFDDDLVAGTTNLQNVDLSGGSINGGQTGVINILGNLTMSTDNGIIGRADLTVSGTTTVPAGNSLTFNSAVGTKIFSNDVTVNGSWINSGNETFTLSGDLTVNATATFTQGTGTYTFNGTTKEINGTISDIDFQNLIIDGAITNNISDIDIATDITINSGSFTNEGDISTVDDLIINAGTYTNNNITFIGDDISGAGTYTQGNNSYLTIVDDATVTNFNSSASGNTVEYYSTGGTNIRGNTYHHLIVSQAGAATRYLDNAENTITVNGDLTISDDAILRYQRYTAQTLNVIGNVSGTGSIYFDVRNSVHNLNLSGANNAIGGFTVVGANNFTVDYNGTDQQVISANNYDLLTISGSGNKTMQGDVTANDIVSISAGTLNLNSNNLTTSSSVNIASGATLDVNDNSQLLIANTQTLTNNGTLRVVGTSGNEAIITINGAGNYNITQPTAGAILHAQYYQFNYLNNGIAISDGTINATNNFSNGSFSNGIGTQYIDATGINVGALGNITNTVFNVGPTYNVTRTSGTGTLTFEDASGALSGENFDNDNGNPGTLINWTYPSSIYYSNPLGTFSAGTLTDWTRNSDGSGGNPASLSNGLASLIVQDGHTVTVDNAGGDIDVLSLQVGEGTSGIFRIGEDGTQRTITIQEKLDVQTGGIINVVSTGSPSHILVINGNINNNGTINLRTTSSNIVNTEFNGASTLISGSSTPIFNDITLKSGSDVTTSVSLDINNNIFFEDNSILQDGGLSHNVAGNWTADGTASMTGSGTIVFDGIVNTIENGTATSFTFNNVIFNGGTASSIQENIIVTGNFEIDNNTTCNTANYSITIGGDFTINAGSTYGHSANTTTFNGTGTQTLDFSGDVSFYNLTFSNGGANAKTVSGNITANNRVTISSGSTVDGPGTQNIAGGLRIDGTCNFSGIVNLTGNSLLTYSATNSLTLGTAVLNIEGNVNLTYGGSATSLQANIFNNVNINNGYLILNNNTSLVGQAGNDFNLNAGRVLYVRGTNNFPTGFGTYNLDITSRVEYDAGFDQTVRGNLNYGTLRLEISGTKTVDEAVDVDGQLQLYDNITFDLQNFNHTFASDITNEAGGCTISGASANVTLDDPNSTQYVQAGVYSFNDLNITLSSGTENITKTFYSGSTISINGNFDISNTLGSPSIFLTINFNDNGIGGTPNNFNLGSYCQFNTTNTTFDVSAMNNFAGTITLDPTTKFYYSLAGAQNIAGGFTYGNITFNGGDKIATGILDIDGDISRTANTPVFYDGGFIHNLQGDWLLNNTAWYTQASATGTIVFDGVDHDIRGYNFNNITFNNTGTATSLNNLNVYGNLTVENGATFDADIRSISIGGDFLVNPTGLFTQQNTGVTTFNGTANQSLNSNANSYFGDLTLNKPNAVGNQTVSVLSELHINDYFRITTDAGVLDISNQNAYFGGNFYIYNNTVEAGNPFISTNSTVYFNGGDAQNIKNYDLSDLSFNNIILSGAGDKTFDYENTIPSSRIVDVNGDFTINGSAVSGIGFGDGGIDFNIAGNWSNTGSFTHNNARTVTFDGGNQNISSSAFGNVVFSGTNTKTLLGNISLSADLTIEAGVTLDANSNSITLAGDWDNDAVGSVYTPGTGTVTFEGNTADIFAGTGAGKSFYNVIANKNAGQTTDMETDIDIDNDLTISSGYLRTQSFDIWVGGDFVVSGGTFNHNNNASRLTLDATSGTKTFDPGASGTTFRGITIDATSVTYNVQNDFTISQNQDFILTDGYFDLNGNTMTVVSNNQTLALNGGTFEIDEGASLSFSNTNQQISIAGATFKLVGTFASNASLTRTGGTYTVTQTSGTFHAHYYRVELCNGITISGGSIDGTNDFSNGTFSNGAGSAYLTLTGLNFADFNPTNVLFNSGPTYNVSRTSGTGIITFEDSFGSLAGENYDEDNGTPGTLIEWTFPTGFFWDGGDLVDDEDWNRDDNWSGNTLPTNMNLVILNHDYLGAYTVRITAANAVAYRLLIDDQSTGNGIDLVLENAYDLDVDENIFIGSNTTLTQTNNTNTITIGQNYINEGTLNNGNSTITFDGPAGSFSISSGGSGAGKSFYNFTINASGATYNLSDVLDVDNNLTVTDGTLDLGANTNDITVAGNWTIDLVTGGVFTHNNADVTLDGINQNIDGGTFYNLLTSNSGIKQLQSNIDVDNDVVIAALTTLDAQDYSIYVGDDWTNNGNFSQTGLGGITFDGTQGQNIDNGTVATDFNYLTFSNGGAKTFFNSSNVNADFIINVGSGAVDVNTYTITGVGGTNEFNLNSTLYIRGVNNFPSGFETISLASNSVIDYLGTIDQTIYSTTYGNLRLRSSGATTTKTAAGDLIILGWLDMDNDALTTLDMDANSANMTITGNIYALGDDITWGTGTSTLTHNGGNWNIDPDLATFNNMILSGSGNKWMYGDLIVTGDVTVQNGVYLRMYRNNDRSQPHTMTGAAGKTFTLENGARCYSPIDDGTGSAIPTNFGTYNLADNSNYYLYSPDGVNQILYTGSSITYGNLYFYGVKNVTSDGVAILDVNGIFDMNTSTYIDNGQNMNLAGSYIYFTNYTPSASTVTVNLDGSINQRISDDINNQIDIGTLVCSGSATKTLCDGNDILNISGDVTINGGVDVTSTEIINFAGTNWTNNGTFSHTAQTLTFNGTADQTINPGAADPSTYFNNVYFDNANTVTFITNGADIDGTFTINNGTVDLGALSHNIEGTITNTASTLTSNLATITLDGWNQNMNTPAFSVANINISGAGGTKRLFSNWTVSNDLTINTGTYLNTSDNVGPTYYDLNVGGNWTNSGTFVDNTCTVTFNGTSSPVNIESGGSNFYNVDFNPGAAVTYNLISASTRIARTMDVQTNASLNLNSNSLILGSNIAAGKTYTVDGSIIVNENASLLFNNQNSQSVMNVSGTLQVVGTNSSNIATISREVAGVAGNETQINILNLGTLAAQYYLIEYLQDNGLIMQSGSVLDATNNLSNGTWSNIRNAANVCYINMECTYAGGDITDLTFNFSGTPTQGTHYNVRRNVAAPAITFDNVSGNLGSYKYEDDDEGTPAAATGLLIWPAVTETNWTGAVNSDWHTAGNWDNGVPTNLLDAIIPNRSNDPRISNSDAECKNLTITDGSLIIESDRRLDTYGDVTIGTGTNVGILTISTSNSILAVGGLWTRGTSGIFSHGNATVIFNSSAGSATILPRTSNFYKVQFNNALTTFYLSGTNITFENDFEIANGVVTPTTNNYTYNIEGDFNNSGGTFTPTAGGVTNGTVVLNGASNQNITGGTFHNLTISGSANKITNGATSINNITTINSTLTANAGSNIDFDGNVTINVGGTFNDGNETHTFTGLIWTGDGSYAGSGTIEFDRTTADQDIYGGTFYNLEANCTGQSVDLFGDVTINNNLTLKSGIDDMDLDTYQITNSSGTGTFTIEGSVYLYVSGANNFPTNFGTYSLNSTTRVYYNGTMNQSIAPVSYGHVYLYNENTKSLTGDILIQGNLYFITNPTLDVTTNNYNIEIGGTWDNDQSAGIFLCHSGEVEFNGNSANQNIYIGVLASNEFYDITVNNSGGGDINANSNVTYTIKNNLHVTNGRFDGAGRTIYVGGDLLASGGGTFATNSTYILNSVGAGSLQVGTNGSTIFNLTINSAGGATYVAQDNISLNGDFNLDVGTFNGNGNTISLGNGTTDIVSIIGTYQIGPGGRLGIGNGTTLTVDAAGTLEAVGSTSNIVTISQNTSGGRYNFNVNGNISVKYYLFEYMSSSGIYLSGTSTINNTNNFSSGTFTRGANSGQLFRVENTQNFTGANRINDVSFPINPGGSAANVTKNSAGSGTLEFYNATGAFSGETYDLDPNNLIDWTGPVTLTWNGSVSTNWNDVGNWTASSGPDMVPTGAEDVIIAPAVNQPILTTFGAKTANLTINSSATIILNTPNDAGVNDLDINGDLNIDGTLRLNTSDDYISVEGNWTKTGTVVINGNVTFDGSGSSKSINNGSTAFYNLTIGGTSTYQLAVNTTVTNSFIINSGSQLDVTATDYDLTIKGNWTNNGTFNAQDGEVIFNATSGTKIISAGSSAFNDIEINASGVTYRMSGGMSIDGDFDIIDGTFDFNNQTLNMGDGVGTDYFTITGTCLIDDNATLSLGNNVGVNVNSGGTINIVGTDGANVATVSKQSSGNYSFDINSGGTINAQYYLFEYMDVDGIYVHNGATVGSSNDFSDGTFANGFATGTSLKLENDVAISEYINNVVFNSGSLYNVTRTTGTNEIYFADASGPLGTYAYELDDIGSPDASNGLLRWSYINTNIWDGDQNDNNWHNADNWSGGVVPDLTKNAIIPNVAFDPIISVGAAQAKRVSLEPGAVLTVNNQNFTVAEEFYYQGSVVAIGSPNITVGDNWSSSSGSFTPDNSTVILNTASGTRDITIGSDNFYNLEINSVGIYQLNGDLAVSNNLTITSGTLNSNNYDITVSGGWTNNGNFTEGLRTVTFNASSGTHDIDNGSDSFYNLVINSGNGSGTATFRLQDNTDISNDFSILKGTMDLSSDGGTTSYNLTIDNRMLNSGGTLLGRDGQIQVGENWLITGSGVFTCGNSTVELTSNAGTRTIDPGSSNFYNLTLSGIAIFRISDNTIIENDINISSGTLDVSSSPSYNLTVTGNWTNTGSFNERTGTTTFNGANQTITNASGETFYTLIVNNTSLTLASGDINVTNTLNLTSGNILAGSNRLILGTSTANIGTFSYTAGNIVGEFERWLNALGTDYIFPVGTATNNNSTTLRFLAGLTSGSLIVEFVESDPGTSGLPLDDAGYIINNIFPDGYWNVTSQNSLACTDYNLILDGTGFNSTYTIDADTRVVKRTNSGVWDLTGAGSHAAAVTPICYRNGLNGISDLGTQFGLGLRVCEGGTIANPTTTICSGDDADAFTNTVSPSGGAGYTYTWQYSTVLAAVPGDANWTDIGSSNSLTYDPGVLTETTLYVRKADSASGCIGSQYSNSITITVNLKPTTGTIYHLDNN